MAKIFTRRIITLLVILILLEIVLCVSIEDKALASDSLLTISEKYLVKKYGWMEGNYVKRWPDGVVYVYNGTNYKGLPSIIKKINQTIGGKTVFQLSNDKEISKVVLKSYDAPIEYSSQSDWSWDGYNLKKWETSIDKKYDKKYIHRDELFLIIFIQIAGFNYQADEKYYGEWWEFSIDINVEKMLKALYKVPPGYNLSTGKVDDIAKPPEEIDTQKTGAIKLTSTPSGAQVFLDAHHYIGKTPLTIDKISPGKHKVTLILADYESYVQEVDVIAGKVIDVSATFSTIPVMPKAMEEVIVATEKRSDAASKDTTTQAKTVKIVFVDESKPIQNKEIWLSFYDENTTTWITQKEKTNKDGMAIFKVPFGKLGESFTFIFDLSELNINKKIDEIKKKQQIGMRIPPGLNQESVVLQIDNKLNVKNLEGAIQLWSPYK